MPCLNEKGSKGHYELSVFSSESLSIHALPEQYSRSLAGDWTDANAGGSHLFPNWKKNPKYTLSIHHPPSSNYNQHSDPPAKVCKRKSLATTTAIDTYFHS